MATLISDINAAHSARNSSPDGCAFIARLLLKTYSVDEIFAHAEKWAMSNDVREAVRFNGAVGVVDLATGLYAARERKESQKRQHAAQRSDLLKELLWIHGSRKDGSLDEEAVAKVNNILVKNRFDELREGEYKDGN